jgi:DNA-binding response OmpR family regulator
MLLERAGYETVKCHDFGQMDRHLGEKSFALVIVDDQRSALNIVEFCVESHKQSATACIPIILLLPVNKNGSETILPTDCRLTVLRKPILPHLLIKTVADVLLESKQLR